MDIIRFFKVLMGLWDDKEVERRRIDVYTRIDALTGKEPNRADMLRGVSSKKTPKLPSNDRTKE